MSCLVVVDPQSLVHRRDVKGMALEDASKIILGDEGTLVEILIKKVTTQVARSSKNHVCLRESSS